MKKIIALLIIAISPAFAILAPLHQSVKEIDSILTSPQLPEYLPSAAQITEITKVEGGYLIISTTHLLRVKVEYKKSSMVGPRKYTLCFEKAIAL